MWNAVVVSLRFHRHAGANENRIQRAAGGGIGRPGRIPIARAAFLPNQLAVDPVLFDLGQNHGGPQGFPRIESEGKHAVRFCIIVQHKPMFFMLFLQLDRLAASRACCTAGNSKAIKMAIIAITTNNSINVNPIRFLELCRVDIKPLPSIKTRTKTPTVWE